MNSRQRHKRRVQKWIAHVHPYVRACRKVDARTAAFRTVFLPGAWVQFDAPSRTGKARASFDAVRSALDAAHLMTEADVERYRSTEYGARWMPPTTTPAAPGVGPTTQENQ